MADSAKPVENAEFLIDSAGNILTWNEACRSEFGLAPDEALHKPVQNLFAPALWQESERALQLLPASQGSVELDTGNPAQAGARRLKFAARFDEAGAFTGCSVSTGAGGAAGLSADEAHEQMAAQCKAEREEISQLPLEQLLELWGGPFYVLDQAGRLLLWNRQLEMATGKTGEELYLVNYLELLHPAHREMAETRFRKVLERDTHVQMEAAFVPHGPAKPYLFNSGRFNRGGHFYVCGMALDVSQKRQQEESLRLLLRAVSAASNGIVITRCAGNDNPIEYVNPAFERITGYTAAESLGRDSRFMAAPGLDKAERADLRQAIAERREINVVFRNRRKDGGLFWNDLRVTPVADETGNVTHFVGVINDITAMKERTDSLEHEVNHDPLTGLANRNLLWDRLEQALHAAQRNKSLVAVIFFDLNKFKQINDTLGHEVGDQVLRVVAKRLQATVRDTDTVARLSGDEFVLVLADQPSLRFTVRMIERLRANLIKPVAYDSQEIEVGASIGISVFPHDGATAFELVRAADVAMYHSKADGKGDVHFFSADMRSTAEAKQQMEKSMREAMENNEFFLAFQPRYCLKTRRMMGVEALLRWRHPEQGVLLPASFLAEAEENGLIVPFGHWVIEHSCMLAQRLKQLGHHDIAVSFNASYREFSEKDYVDRIEDAVRRFKLGPGSLELELKEDQLMRDQRTTRQIVDRIYRLGVRITVDDFGDGLSSLRYLQDLPASRLKMSSSLLRELGPSGRGGVMAKTMIDIGHNLHIDVLAEGVETREQYDFLLASGCDEIQGNYFSAPVEQPMLVHLLSAGPGGSSAMA
jgi:diguanylate cyclase (GGDEF)-like protein/PAS domain S-box-containing protein